MFLQKTHNVILFATRNCATMMILSVPTTCVGINEALITSRHETDIHLLISQGKVYFPKYESAVSKL